MRRTFFTADHHFGHMNIIKYCHRPYATVEDMDEDLIARWNSTVRPNDTVYHLGDFTLCGRRRASEYFARLNGRITVIPGGHDWRWRKGTHRSAIGHRVWVERLSRLTIRPLLTSSLWLCHYPPECAGDLPARDPSRYAVLHGHSHGRHAAHTYPPGVRAYDVGVDVPQHGYRPIALDAALLQLAAAYLS